MTSNYTQLIFAIWPSMDIGYIAGYIFTFVYNRAIQTHALNLSSFV